MRGGSQRKDNGHRRALRRRDPPYDTYGEKKAKADEAVVLVRVGPFDEAGDDRHGLVLDEAVSKGG